MAQLRLRSSSFHEQGSSSGALGVHERGSGSGAVFFHDSGSSSGFDSFSHINTLNCLGVPQVEWKINEIKYSKPGENTKHF